MSLHHIHDFSENKDRLKLFIADHSKLMSQEKGRVGYPKLETKGNNGTRSVSPKSDTTAQKISKLVILFQRPGAKKRPFSAKFLREGSFSGP